MTKLLITSFFALLQMSVFCQDFLRQNTKITFDNENYLIFEDVGRIQRENSMTGGKYVLLHITRGNSKYDVALVNTKYDLNDTRYSIISSQVEYIKYRDKDSIWVISRQGHNGDRALLYDIVNKQPIRSYGGYSFKLSPDARQIAYYRRLNNNRNTLVFIGDVLVYPKISPVAAFKNKEGAIQSFVKDSVPSEDESSIEWKNNNELEFRVKEEPKGIKPYISKMKISDITTSGTTLNINRIRIERNTSMIGNTERS